MLDAGIDDWHLFLNVAIPLVLAVPADSPYGSLDGAAGGFQGRPRGNYGLQPPASGPTGHSAMEQIRGQTDLDYRHLAFSRR